MLLADSSVIIAYLARGAYISLVETSMADGRLVLSSVVAEEVLAGARHEADRRRYTAFFDRFARRSSIVTPDDVAWRACGRLISRYRERFGDLEPRDHQNDVLILVAALRLAQSGPAELLTENGSDFRSWLRLIHNRTGLRVTAVRRA